MLNVSQILALQVVQIRASNVARLRASNVDQVLASIEKSLEQLFLEANKVEAAEATANLSEEDEVSSRLYLLAAELNGLIKDFQEEVEAAECIASDIATAEFEAIHKCDCIYCQEK